MKLMKCFVFYLNCLSVLSGASRLLAPSTSLTTSLCSFCRNRKVVNYSQFNESDDAGNVVLIFYCFFVHTHTHNQILQKSKGNDRVPWNNSSKIKSKTFINPLNSHPSSGFICDILTL